MLTKASVPLSMAYAMDLNTSIMIGIGFTAMLVGIMLLQKRKALFMENEAFYLFSGPFNRPQIMRYLMSSNLLSALMCGLVSIFMMVTLGQSLAFDIVYILLSLVAHMLVYYFFTTLYYYVYLLSIKNEKMKNISYIVVGGFVVILAVLFVIAFLQSDNQIKAAGMYLINSDLFYYVPLFGWIKLVLVSYVANDMAMIALGLILLIIACGIIYQLMCSYKEDFVEKAMQDAEEFSALYKEMKAGKRSTMNDHKVRDVHSSFMEGAGAIFSKNMLLMRKTNDFLRFADVMVVVIYFIIAWILDMGFAFYGYMLIFYLFNTIQSSDFMRDMNNYQIYLIPDKPIKKLFYVLLPTFIKLFILMAVSVLGGGILLGAEGMEMVQFGIMLAGYLMLFLSATVLSLRILKSRSNMILQGMMRMGIVVLAALPSLGLVIYYASQGILTLTALNSIPAITLAMNFIISIVILVLCADMMNGREVQSE